MGFGDFFGSIFKPDAPELAPMGDFEYNDFDYFGSLNNNLGNASNTAAIFNEQNFPGMASARMGQLGQLNSLASQLLSGGLSAAQRDELGQSNAELTSLGFGGGFGSSMDGLRGIRMRTDTILNNQLTGANLARGNINQIGSLLVDPNSFLSGSMNSAYNDYQFGRNAAYNKFQNNYQVANQNKAIQYQNDLSGDLLYQGGMLVGSQLDEDMAAARGFFSSGGMGFI